MEQAPDMKALGAEMIAAVKDYVRRALDPLSARLAATETRCAALAMMRAEASAGNAPELLRALGAMEARIEKLATPESLEARIEAVEARLVELASRIESLERRSPQ